MHIVRMNGAPASPTEAATQLHAEFGLFRFFDYDFDGVTLFAIDRGTVVAYCQYTHVHEQSIYIWQIESFHHGCGRMLVNYLQDRYESITAKGVLVNAKGFWEQVGFNPEREEAEEENCVEYRWWSQW